jgi:hypothetical protein
MARARRMRERTHVNRTLLMKFQRVAGAAVVEAPTFATGSEK